MEVDPDNRVIQVFLRRCGIRPAEVPKPEKRATVSSRNAQDLGDKFESPPRPFFAEWARHWYG
jgi:hypothetical protein